ncbi:MAG: hypothetical protein LBG76_00635, partial [Treponema sp.]|nr:hypothetical protein [Treponema sp.]
GFAAPHYALSPYSGAQTLSLGAGVKHYYRLAVTAGSSYTIEWQNGNNQNTDDWWFRISVWQNDGTLIFGDTEYHARGGYTNPLVFTAASTGFVTVELRNGNSSNSYNYQIYYY